VDKSCGSIPNFEGVGRSATFDSVAVVANGFTLSEPVSYIGNKQETLRASSNPPSVNVITHSAANSDIARRSGSHDRSHHHVLFDDHIASRDGYHDNTHHHHRSPRHDIAHHHHPNPGSPTHRDGGMSVSSHSSHSHSLISETLDTSNKLAWKQVEQRIMHEISAIAFPLERNKQWTGEKPVELMTKQRLSMEKICRTIAKLRTKSLMQVIDAIKDDEERDKARQEAEYKCTKKSKLQELKEKHEKERHDHRTYLRTLQYNNEVILINKMNEFGLLW